MWSCTFFLPWTRHLSSSPILYLSVTSLVAAQAHQANKTKPSGFSGPALPPHCKNRLGETILYRSQLCYVLFSAFFLSLSNNIAVHWPKICQLLNEMHAFMRLHIVWKTYLTASQHFWHYVSVKNQHCSHSNTPAQSLTSVSLQNVNNSNLICQIAIISFSKAAAPSTPSVVQLTFPANWSSYIMNTGLKKRLKASG